MAPKRCQRYSGPPDAPPVVDDDEADFEMTPKLEQLATAVCEKGPARMGHASEFSADRVPTTGTLRNATPVLRKWH